MIDAFGAFYASLYPVVVRFTRTLPSGIVVRDSLRHINRRQAEGWAAAMEGRIADVEISG